MISLKSIFELFKTGKVPTENNFRDTFSSFWHKSEKIPQSQVFGLQETIESATHGLIYRPPVETSADLETTYPEAKTGWAAIVEETGTIWQCEVQPDNTRVWTDTGLKEFPKDVATREELGEYAKSGGSDKTVKELDENIVQLAGEVSQLNEISSSNTESYSFAENLVYNNIFIEIFIIDGDSDKTYGTGNIFKNYNGLWQITIQEDKTNWAWARYTYMPNDTILPLYKLNTAILVGYIVVDWGKIPEGINFQSGIIFNRKIFNITNSPAISLLLNTQQVDGKLDQVDGRIDYIDEKSFLATLQSRLDVNAASFIRAEKIEDKNLVYPASGTIENIYISDINESYGIPNVTRITGVGMTNANYPTGCWYVSPADLGKIGIIPDDVNPPIISMRMCTVKKTRVNCTANTLYFCLRYGGSINGYIDSTNDVMIFNNQTSWAWAGAGDDAFWNSKGHTVSSIDNSEIFGYVHRRIPIPATYKGKTLTGIFLITRANNTGDCQYDMCMPFVIKDSDYISDIATYINDSDKNKGVIKENNLSPALAQKINSSDSIKSFNLKTVDRLLLSGASFTAGGGRDFRDKGWICYISQLSDWNCEGYGQSGDGYIDLYNAILSNTKRYSNNVGIRDYNKTYFLISIVENDTNYHTFNPSRYWRDVITRTVRLVKSLGAIPILHTNFGNFASSDVFAILRDVAEKENCLFWDISSTGYLFNQNRYLKFWDNGHPGVRTNTLLWYETLKLTNLLPSPKTGIKVFRNRSTYTYSDINDLLYTDITNRAEKWREISIGHGRATDDTAKYYDELDKRMSVTYKQPSEYLALINNENVEFTDKALIVITMPSTSEQLKNFEIVLNNNSVSAYVRKYIDDSQIVDLSKTNVGFRLKVAGSGNAGVGAVYKSSDNKYNGITFTIVETTNEIIIVSPSETIASEGLSDGNLIKISGIGDETIEYEAIFLTFSTEYINRAFKPVGIWETLSKNEAGNFIMSKFNEYMDYDKIEILLNNGSIPFSLSSIQVNYKADGEKIIQNKQKSQISQTGTNELLSENYFGEEEISNWNNPSMKVPFIPDDSNTPVGCPSTCIDLELGESVSQNFTVNIPAGTSHRLKITAYARRFPAIFDSTQNFNLHDNAGDNEIFEDSFDFAKLKFKLERTQGAANFLHEFEKIVPLWWVMVEEEIYLTAPKNVNYKFSIECSSKEIQLAFASVKAI